MIETFEERTMKIHMIIRVAVVALAVVALAACGAGGDSPEDLARRFYSDINAGNYSSITVYLDSGASNYNQVNASYWTSRTNATYTEISLSGDGPVTGTVKDGGGTTVNVRFTFSGSEGSLFQPSDYKIRTIEEDGSTIFQ